jgi:hypothetical protein
MATANRPSTTYLQREESFMYDRENRFKMEDTMNAGRLEYTENGMTHVAARRCDVIRISLSGAIIAFVTQVSLPKQFYFDIPDARISKVGAILMKTFANNTAEIRFLRLLTQKELDRIFVFSTHPAHKDRVLDVRSW